MADNFIDNIKIGSTEAPIAAPRIVTKVGPDGVTPLSEPAFKNFYEVGDFTKEVKFDDAPRDVWEVSLTGKYDKTTPSITCLDEDGDIIFGDVKYDISASEKKITITFSQLVKGKVIIN